MIPSKIYSLFFIILFVCFANKSSAVEGCLIGNTFYTTYLGQVTSSPSDNSFTGSRKVFNVDGQKPNINYGASQSCNSVKASENLITRTGPLCFVMTRTKYNSYPNGVAPNYPGGNGTLENYTVYIDATCPIDDYVPLLVIFCSLFGFFAIRKLGHI